jgi:hypothetical protein
MFRFVSNRFNFGRELMRETTTALSPRDIQDFKILPTSYFVLDNRRQSDIKRNHFERYRKDWGQLEPREVSGDDMKR